MKMKSKHSTVVVVINRQVIPYTNLSLLAQIDFNSFQLILSQPPIWEEHSPFGYIGEFHAGDKIDVNVIAKVYIM